MLHQGKGEAEATAHGTLVSVESDDGLKMCMIDERFAQAKIWPAFSILTSVLSSEWSLDRRGAVNRFSSSKQHWASLVAFSIRLVRARATTAWSSGTLSASVATAAELAAAKRRAAANRAANKASSAAASPDQDDWADDEELRLDISLYTSNI